MYKVIANHTLGGLQNPKQTQRKIYIFYQMHEIKTFLTILITEGKF